MGEGSKKMNRKYLVRQRDIKDCGVCCLASIIRYYKGDIPLEKIRLDTKTNLEGTTAYNLIEAAKKYGFVAKGVKAKNLNQNLRLPAIAHIVTKHGLNHFIVIYKINSKYVYIMDPGTGYRKEPIEEFSKKWTNVILLFKPYKRIPLYEIKNSLKDLILKVIESEHQIIKSIIITDILITVLSIILSYYLQIAMSIQETNIEKYLLFIIFLFLSFNIFKIIFDYYRNNLSIHLSKNIDLKIIPEFITHMFKLPLNVITSRTGGELLTRIQEMNSIKNLFTKVIISITLDTFLILATCMFLPLISKKLFLILCITATIYVLVGILTSSIIYRKINDNIDSETEFNSELVEKIDGIESIKNLDYNDQILKKITNKYVDYEKTNFSLNIFQNKLYILKTIINSMGMFCINSIGILEISKGNLSLISLITFNFLISYFLEPIQNFIDLIPEYNLIKLSFTKACEILNLEEEKSGKVEEFSNGKIEFNNVTYSYNDYENVLNNLNLIIQKNNHVIIRGSSGCGKSTICQILNGNLKDYKGIIKIDNINIKDYNTKTLKNNILYISQREQLFSDSIKNNITLNQKVSKKDLDEILELTEVKEIIDKKSTRLDTVIYDGGFNISGGERQRIILARSILRKPKILILDESLNQVEEEREKRIINKLDKYLKETTIIYVSHNKENYFDNIINMEKSYE